MNAHFLGRDQNQYPSSPSTAEGTSLAVRQWVELARGEREVAAPRWMFRIEAVRAEERYCLRCCDVRRFDVVISKQSHLTWKRLAVCRCCHEEYWL